MAFVMRGKRAVAPYDWNWAASDRHDQVVPAVYSRKAGGSGVAFDVAANIFGDVCWRTNPGGTEYWSRSAWTWAAGDGNPVSGPFVHKDLLNGGLYKLDATPTKVWVSYVMTFTLTPSAVGVMHTFEAWVYAFKTQVLITADGLGLDPVTVDGKTWEASDFRYTLTFTPKDMTPVVVRVIMANINPNNKDNRSGIGAAAYRAEPLAVSDLERIDLVNLADIAYAWQKNTAELPGYSFADIYQTDGVVDEGDLTVLADHWLAGLAMGLEGWWRMDANVNDSSGCGRHGNLSTAGLWKPGVMDAALAFDGTSDYVDIPGYKGVTGAGARTCAAWIKTPAVSGDILTWGSTDVGRKWILRVNENGTLRAEVSGGYLYGTTVLTDNRWHHIAVVLPDAPTPTVGDIRLYVDGQPETVGQVNTPGLTIDTAATEDVRIGVYGIGTPRYFKGLIDDVRVYDRALSAWEISKLADVTVQELGPMSWVFLNGTEGYAVYRCTTMTVTQAGTILAFSEGRVNSHVDEDDMDVVLKRSTDGGKTWGPLQVIANDGKNPCKNQCPVVLPSGRILLVWLWNEWISSEAERTTRQVYITYSDDDGVTWANHINITGDVYGDNWGWYGTGPCHAIVKTRPPHQGRIIIPARHNIPGVQSTKSHLIYTDDPTGLTGWTIGAIALREQSNESTVVELSNGDLMLNSRNGSDAVGEEYRVVHISKDGGQTFVAPWYLDHALPDAGRCQGSILEHSINSVTGKSNILFSNPNDLYERRNGTIKLNENDGAYGSWVRKIRYSDPNPAFCGYSDIAVLNAAGDIGVLFERGVHYLKPRRWIGGVAFRVVPFDAINDPMP